MLRISRLTDYAVIITTELARHPGAVAVSDLSIATEVPAPTVSKVLKTLAKCGVVVSSRGTHGGYRLSDEPDRIAIVRVIEAIEGPIAVTECAEEHTACEHETSCGVRANWQRINRAVHDALAAISIADMMSPSIGGARLVPLLRSGAEADVRRAQSTVPPTDTTEAAPPAPRAASAAAGRQR